MPNSTRARAILLVVLPAAVVLIGAAAVPRGTAPTAPTVFGPGEAAMRATIDPETGVLGVASGSDPVLDAELQEALRRDDKGLQRVVHPDGSVSIHLQGRFQNAAVATLGPDGAVVICSETADGLHAPAPAPAAEVQ